MIGDVAEYPLFGGVTAFGGLGLGACSSRGSLGTNRFSV